MRGRYLARDRERCKRVATLADGESLTRMRAPQKRQVSRYLPKSKFGLDSVINSDS